MGTLWRIIFLCAVLAGVSGNEGRRFLLAFPPDWQLINVGFCQIIINTNTLAEITIRTFGSMDQLTVNAGSYIYSVPCTMRADPGHSNNAIIVESDVDITVQVYTMRLYYGDSYLAVPLRLGSQDYTLITTRGQCDTSNALVGSIFTMAAEMDDTLVEVYAPAPGGYTIVDTIMLNRFGTYTNASAFDTGADFTGWKVRSEKPISVITGTSCFRVGCTSDFNSGYIFAPSPDQAGYQFIVPKITKPEPGDTGAYIRVISTSEDNLIELPDQSISHILHSGEFLEHHVSEWDEIVRVQCSDQCFVAIFNENRCNTFEGNTLMYVTPLEHRVDIRRFVSMETDASSRDLINHITIISDTTNVRIDDMEITGWRALPEWTFYEVAFEIEHGEHILQSTDGGKFVAFVYGSTLNRGYGLEVVRNEAIAESV